MEQHNIIDGLLVLKEPIGSVLTDPRNAREGHDIERLSASLEKYGQRKPIVVNRATKHIIAGNGTWASAKSLGWTHIAAVWVDDDPETAIGYAIADNRLAELSEWNTTQLADLLSEIDRDELETGFDENSVGLLLAAVQENSDISFGSDLMDEFVADIEYDDDGGSEFAPIVLEENYPLTLVFTEFDQRSLVEAALKVAKGKFDTNSSADALYFLMQEISG